MFFYSYAPYIFPFAFVPVGIYFHRLVDFYNVVHCFVDSCIHTNKKKGKGYQKKGPQGCRPEIVAFHIDAFESSSLIFPATTLSSPFCNIKTLILIMLSGSHEITSIEGSPMRRFSASFSLVIFTFA